MRRLLCAWFLLAAGAAAQNPAQQSVIKSSDSVTVSADRGLVGINDSASSVSVLFQEQLEQAPGLALDDRLHSQAGFQLFRRTSSWTANPTTQGLSLRGLGSTAASRTLVVSDQVPMNDPFGGWIHWSEIPALAIKQVRLLRGGSADLYGSSAISGVIDVEPAEAKKGFQLDADASGATEDSSLEDALISGPTRWAAMLGAFSGLKTGGYIPTAPALRGRVDIPSNVTAESGRVMLGTPSSMKRVRTFLLGNVLNESRSNGTPLQTNGTRLWRYVGGAESTSGYGVAALRFFGSRESYRQSFSSIATDRNSETLTKFQHVPLDEIGVVAQGSRALPYAVTTAIGVDLHDVRATDDETAVSHSVAGATTSISARQRETGGYVDAIWQPGAWSVSGSIRVDSFRTFDARKVLSTAAVVTPLPELDELFVSPHVGLVRRLPHGVALTGTAFRAFRGPTMNELYRTGQVGQQTTLANNSLLAERATGFEFGGESVGKAGRLRATYFWTEVNRPISAVVLSQMPAPPAPAMSQTLQRQNLGQIRSRGVMVEAQTTAWRGLDASLGYQLAVATVTAFNATSAVQANLKGNWIPEVPRESVTATANYVSPRLVSVHLIASYAGREFDDAANQYVLHPYARLDVSVERDLHHGLSCFAAAQNLLNRSIDAGRTPILTLAAPRLVQAGLRYRFSR
jgi:outer membrane receptor protein involved in Fe transport